MARRKTLSATVAEDLRRRIRSGELAPGARIPTETELGDSYEVSRTVIREAIASLRSDALLISQQGRGVFVSDTLPPRRFEIAEDVLGTLPETLSLLELRLAVETESAGLCAERRTDREAAAIRHLMEGIDAGSWDPDTVSLHYDYDFHLAIAAAARNPFIERFLLFLQPTIVPRFELGHIVAREFKTDYYEAIHREHDAIVTAIERSDAQAARHAMRQHLHNSLDRLRDLAETAGIEKILPSERTTSLIDTLLDRMTDIGKDAARKG